VGNPVTPASGVKVLSETDYRHARGLSFTRNYHSFRFYKPLAIPADIPPPNQLGIVWRSNYEKRVIPLGLSPEVYAMTTPTGEIQYFDNAGGEIFNYRGAKARLVVTPGGYTYQGPEDTEFYRADGRLQSIARRSGEVFTVTYSDGTTGPNGGFTVDLAGNPTSTPLPANFLLRVTDSYGNTLSFGHSTSERLVVITDPGGGRTFYSYDKNENLTSVKYPDGRVRRYVYNEPANIDSGITIFIHALTSIVDENGGLFASYKYDGGGRAKSTEHAGGAQLYQLVFNGYVSTTVTDPLGTTRTFQFQNVDGLHRLTANSLPGGAGFGTGVQNRAYDATGNVLSQTDFNNVKTCYAYDLARNLETARVEGVAAATDCAALTAAGAALPPGTRKILTEWHARWRMPARTSEPSRRTTYVYNGDGVSCAPPSAVIADGTPLGVLCAKTVQSTNDADGGQGFAALLQGQPRTWAYAYDARGKVLTADGPRTDVADITTTIYYADDDPDTAKRGNVATITNALGHATSITAYNAHGQPLTIVDPNGLTTTLTYDARQRLASRSVGGELTAYTYDGVGQLTQVNLPDGSSLTYSYDAAHRLTGISDNLGNHIAYTLDAMGNRTKEEVFDPANALAQTRSRVFDNLNRLAQELGAQNQTTQYAYDNQGNLTSVTDPLNQVTANAYDALNRLIRITDPNLGQTQYAYNGIDQLVSVTDPRNLATLYNYDGLANLNSQQSPDTGMTANTYDAAGNLLTQSDAKGQTASYAYDALNRVTLITFADGSKQTYAYDQGVNGVGRLTAITETDPQSQVTSLLAYAYDQHGRTTSETRTINGIAYPVAYSYDSAGRMSGMTYPSGRTIAYGFDALGRVSQVSTTPPPAVGGATQIVASNITYQPFGGVKSYTLGNGQSYTRGFDLDGRIASYSLGAQSFTLGYDAASRVSFLQDNANALASNAYVYDALDRLTNAVLPALDFTYGYDAVGNRLYKSAGVASDSYAYGATSNRLTSITPAGGAVRSFAFDANGSTTDDGANQYLYDARGRLVQSIGTAGATNYQVNALGQRIRKTNVNDDRVFHYDTRGRLIAETDPGGALKREYLYLNDIPLAVIQ